MEGRALAEDSSLRNSLFCKDPVSSSEGGARVGQRNES
jgi:hypothetical protein